MALITFVTAAGEPIVIQAAAGLSVMQVAVREGIADIVAECGGAMMCATCHVYLDEAAEGLFAPRSETEAEMLEMAAAETTEHSRLSCQLSIAADTPDFSVRLPDRQV